MKIYTKKGDKGQTQLLGGSQLAKSEIRIQAYGYVDELNAHIGLLRVSLTDMTDIKKHQGQVLLKFLENQQNQLFTVGSHLSCVNPALLKKLPHLKETWVVQLEEQIDQMTDILPPLKQFILPGGSQAACQAHVCRTICRRTERTCVVLHNKENLNLIILAYFNRMSDYFFVLSRYLNHLQNIPDILWISHLTDDMGLNKNGPNEL